MNPKRSGPRVTFTGMRKPGTSACQRYFNCRLVPCTFRAIFPKMPLKAGQHELYLCKHGFGHLQVVRHGVIIKCKRILTADIHVIKVCVLTKAEGGIIIINGIRERPVITCSTWPRRCFSREAAIGYICKSIGDGDADKHAVRLIRQMIFAGPPQAGARALYPGGFPLHLYPSVRRRSWEY
jgi:hypothetical protein